MTRTIKDLRTVGPAVRGSVWLFPRIRHFYPHAPFHYHASVWSRGPRGRSVKVGAKLSRRHTGGVSSRIPPLHNSFSLKRAP